MKLKYILIVLVLFSACSKDLDVVYKNNPNKDAAFENPEDVYGMASSLFYNWHKAQYGAYTYSPIMAMWTMSDQGTASWANGAMNDLSSEPRIAYNNSEDYGWKLITQTYYERMYANLIQSNDIISVINDGMEIGVIKDEKGVDTEMVKAFSYFNQGITLAYLGLVFDKAFVVTDELDVEIELLETSPYKDAVSTAVASLEKCILVCDNSSFDIPDSWINGSTYSEVELAELAHAFIARVLAYSARNTAENQQTDWAKVLEHAEKGMQRDLAPYMDNTVWQNPFFNFTFTHLTLDWCGIDARIIHLMDNNYPEKYPDLSIDPVPAAAVSADARLLTDFTYDDSCPLKGDRGYYHFYNYEHSRYDYSYNNPKEVVDFSLAELELLKAEALMRLDRKSEAVEVINAGTRVSRGALTGVSSMMPDDMIYDAIFYERDIELIMTGFGISFFDMRRRDMLQKGTMLHFPVPAKELNVLGMDVYSFGGVENADGINTSNGGWFNN